VLGISELCKGLRLGYSWTGSKSNTLPLLPDIAARFACVVILNAANNSNTAALVQTTFQAQMDNVLTQVDFYCAPY